MKKKNKSKLAKDFLLTNLEVVSNSIPLPNKKLSKNKKNNKSLMIKLICLAVHSAVLMKNLIAILL